MGRKKEITLYQLVNTPEGNRYARMVKAARGWAQAKPLEGEPGSYYLRLHKNGKPTFESVGKDLANAVQEMKDRKEALSKPSLVVTALKPKVTLRKAVADFLQMKETKNWQHQLGVFADWYGWERDPGELQRSDFKAYARHAESLGLRPRTEKNYLSNLCTFLRWNGRVVLVAGTEQDATLAKAGAVIVNTLVLVSNDFPTVNQGIPDYYSEAQVKALFGAAKNHWEKTALACFYYTGAREEEVSHLTWKDVRWEENEILVREKPEFEWTTKTFQDREVVHDALIEILREAYEVTNDPTRYHAEGWTFFGTSKLIFPNINGKPEGHFLSKIQRIAYRAGVVCFTVSRTSETGVLWCRFRGQKGNSGLIGIRYWHLGTTLTLPPQVANGYYGAANWVDAVQGARFQGMLTRNVLLTIAGDAGAGGSRLDYQVVGLVGYKLKRVTLQGGWRYLVIHKGPGENAFVDLAMTGVVVGVVIPVK